MEHPHTWKTRHLLAIFIPALLLVGLGLLFEVVSMRPLIGSEAAEETNGIAEIIPLLPEDPVIGRRSAPNAIIVFGDFSCEGCKTQDTIIQELITKHDKVVKLIWKVLPVTRFPINSHSAHEYAYCAHAQGKFSAFKDYAYANSDGLTPETLATIATEIKLKDEPLETCLIEKKSETYIAATEHIAFSLGVQAVPAIFVNHKQIKAPESVQEWELLLGL